MPITLGLHVYNIDQDLRSRCQVWGAEAVDTASQFSKSNLHVLICLGHSMDHCGA